MSESHQSTSQRERFSQDNYTSEEARRKAMFRQARIAVSNLEHDDGPREHLKSIQEDFEQASGDGLDSEPEW